MNPQEENKIVPNNANGEKVTPPKKTGDFLISPLRTYENDVKSVVQSNNISTAKILMAEQQKRQKEQENFEQNSPASKTNILKISLSVFFIVLGLGGVGAGYYFYSKTNTPKLDSVVVVNSNKIIDTESVINISIDNKTNREVVSEIRKIIRNSDSEIKEGTLKEIKLVKTVTTEQDGKEVSNIFGLETSEFFNLLETREPDALVRSLNKEFLLGVHNKKNNIEPFIIFKVDDFEISYAKMLEWKYFLLSDIKDIFFVNLGSSQAFIDEEALQEITTSSTENIATSTTSTSTPPVITKTLNYDEKEFKDLILANRDTRAIIDKDGKLLFFYTFINREYLILTTNIDTLNTIVTRTNSAKLIR
jgi:hypothetical protein